MYPWGNVHDVTTELQELHPSPDLYPLDRPQSTKSQLLPLNQVGNELTKYGEVTSVMIFEVTTPGYEPEEAVRIFIQFDRVESATKAQIDLQVWTCSTRV